MFDFQYALYFLETNCQALIPIRVPLDPQIMKDTGNPLCLICRGCWIRIILNKKRIWKACYKWIMILFIISLSLLENIHYYYYLDPISVQNPKQHLKSYGPIPHNYVSIIADESMMKQICTITPKYKLWDNCFIFCGANTT